jgi:GNAT superfamily N-acetyltransferase
MSYGDAQHGNLLCTAWDGEELIGVARSVTDFEYCCYLSDLAVDLKYQKRGIGRELIRQAVDEKSSSACSTRPAEDQVFVGMKAVISAV